MNRCEFLETVAAAAVLPTLAREDANEWGAPVFDLHFHLRPQPAANLAHLDGAGIVKANLLTRGRVLDQVNALQAAAPGRFTWFNSYGVTQPDAEQVLTQAVKSGAQGFGEMKFHVAADGPELRRMYALAADVHVPILIHFQEVDHSPNEGTWSAGYNNPAAPGMARKCVARETLSLLKRSTSPVIFQKIVWGNVHGLLRIPAS